MRVRSLSLTFVFALAAIGPAHAEFYPFYSSAAHQRATAATPALQPLPPTVVAPRYYAPAYGAAVPATIAPPSPAVTAAPSPAVIAPPVYTSAPVAYPAPYTAAPTYTPPASYPTPYAAPAPAAEAKSSNPRRSNRFYVGVEGYYDRYKEPVVDLVEDGGFGSITYGYTHDFTPQWFAGLEGRASYGQSSYKSISGSIAAIPAFEFDQRIRGGYDFAYSPSFHLKPFIGIAARYYSEGGKGEVSNSSPPRFGYDRRITQIYLPIGVDLENRFAGYSIQSSFEVDPLLWGYVESRFQNLGAPQASNHQTSGYGLRGEVLLGNVDTYGTGWQFGPFVRYWDIDDSKTAECDGPVAGPGFCVLEPANTRLQAGLTARFLF
ncbi:MAG: hypothetical protein ACKVOE_05160 [Rickettsiales bacterium]